RLTEVCQRSPKPLTCSPTKEQAIGELAAGSRGGQGIGGRKSTFSEIARWPGKGASPDVGATRLGGATSDRRCAFLILPRQAHHQPLQQCPRRQLTASLDALVHFQQPI